MTSDTDQSPQVAAAPLRLAVVSDPDDVADRVAAIARVRDVQVTVIADSLAAALRQGEAFDAVVAHVAMGGQAAVESGKHLLLDAPLADSLEAAEALLAAAARAGVCLGVGRLPRYDPANQVIIDRLVSGKLGEPGLLRMHHWSSRREASLARQVFGHIDLAMHLFGAAPTVVYALGRPDSAYVQIHLGFPQGGMAVLDVSERLPTGQHYHAVSLIGSQGAAYSDDHHNTHLLLTGRQPTALISDSGSGEQAELQALVDCVVRGGEPAIAAESILEVHRVIAAAGRSIESGDALHNQGGAYEPA